MLETLGDVAQLLETVFIPILMVELLVLRRLRKLGWSRIKEMAGNASTFLLFLPAGAAGVAIWTGVLKSAEAWVPWSIPTHWWTVVLAILVADFFYYWEHRVGHEVRVLWDLYHSVHHSSPRFDQTTSLRLGIVDGLLSPVYLLPMVLLGFSVEVVLVAKALVIGYQTWLHTELVDKMPRWVEAVFNTPSHHRAHHGNAAPYLDVNYGGVLIIWDRLFGTFQREQETPAYGLTTGPHSSNPFEIQFAQIRGLLGDLRRDRSWRTRWARLWNAPGWTPVQSTPETP